MNHELKVSADQLIVPAPDGSHVLSITCPNSYYAYPKLTNLAKIPADAFAVLDHIWSAKMHHGRDIKFYRFNDVFVVQEGLVFLANNKLIDVTTTYHNEQEKSSAVLRL